MTFYYIHEIGDTKMLILNHRLKTCGGPVDFPLPQFVRNVVHGRVGAPHNESLFGDPIQKT